MKKLLTLVILLTAMLAASASALTPEQIALVVNKNIPASMKLAEYYAQVRHVPDGRIIALDLPSSEEISFDRYEREIVPTVRQFLRDNGLEKQVTCLVTFFGIPIRVAGRSNTPEEKKELADLQAQYGKLPGEIDASVAQLEQIAREIDPAVQLHAGRDLDSLVRRMDIAMQVISRSGSKLADRARRREILGQVVDPLEVLSGRPTVIERLHSGGMIAASRPITPTEVDENRRNLQAAQDVVADLTDKRFDAVSRGTLRNTVRDNFGLMAYARLLRTQIDYLTPGPATVAAFDSELALLWWKAYPRQQMQVNPLFYGVRIPHAPPMLMVMRLDGPQEGTARDIIVSSLKAEAEGLQGQVVIDAGGAARIDAAKKKPAYWQFEDFLADWAAIARDQAKMPVVFDQKTEVLPPGSVKNVALYVGWYSLRHYVASCQLNPGAVGYHVASLEMLSLRNPNENGWVHGLLEDGIAATVGAVAEPYLNAFPRPDDFFPLLLTGKLPLAEVYWRTNPMASWMICAIGDPLYTPYKVNPQLKVEDLPERLRAILEPDATPSPQE